MFDVCPFYIQVRIFIRVFYGENKNISLAFKGVKALKGDFSWRETGVALHARFLNDSLISEFVPVHVGSNVNLG